YCELFEEVTIDKDEEKMATEKGLDIGNIDIQDDDEESDNRNVNDKKEEEFSCHGPPATFKTLLYFGSGIVRTDLHEIFDPIDNDYITNKIHYFLIDFFNSDHEKEDIAGDLVETFETESSM
ncbi:2628_t:CDS:2, partial [Diversispora eburnea]